MVFIKYSIASNDEMADKPAINQNLTEVVNSLKNPDNFVPCHMMHVQEQKQESDNRQKFSGGCTRKTGTWILSVN